MCGLTGIITADGREPSRATLAAMNTAISHRGPDEDGLMIMSGAALGHRRLTILDPDSGRQPMQSADGRYTLTYNGEIYNYRALNETLARHGYQFDGHCDTETLLKAWQHWGPACVERFRGMFAFAIWDALEQRVHLVRDRLGIKPLYYARTPAGDLLFASELKALMTHPELGRELSPEAVETYMAFGYVPEPYAIFKDTYKLSAGHALAYSRTDESLRPEPYWDVSFKTGADNDADHVASDLADRLADAVEMRMVADVPLGAFLSGGVDSSAIVSLMAESSADPVNTCAIGFSQGEFDESDHARRVAEHLHTAHREHHIDGNDFDLVDRLIDVYDEPFADPSALPTYRVCELARRQVKVALSGDGGDENFAGYRRHRMHAAESRARGWIPQALRRPVFGALGRAYPKLDWAPQMFRAKTTFQALAMSTAEAYCHSVSMTSAALRDTLYSPRFKSELQGFRAVDVFHEHARRADTDHPLSLAQYLDFKTYLPGDILTKVDRASMAHGLEVRVPMLDHEFVDWAAGVSPELKLRRGEGKYVLKRAFESRLPYDILYRSKQGFSVPLTDWFRGPLRTAGRRALTEGPLPRSGLFDPAALDNLWQTHIDGQSDHGRTIWSLLMLSRFIEREGGEAAAPSEALHAAG